MGELNGFGALLCSSTDKQKPPASDVAGDKSEPNNKWFIISEQLRALVHDISRASCVSFALTQHLLSL